MAGPILADVTASVTELQKDPIGTAASGNGAAVAILNRNALAFTVCQLMNITRWSTGSMT